MGKVFLYLSLTLFWSDNGASKLKVISKLKIITSLFEIFVNITSPSIISPINNFPKELFNWKILLVLIWIRYTEILKFIF